jgi:uncharacterized membrane protein
MNFLLIILLFFAVDSIWLIGGSSLSSRMIQDIQGSPITIRFIPAVIVYVALAYLVSIPKTSKEAFLLGLSTYAIYDFTNYAILKNYSLQFALMDSIWGGILMTIVWNIIRKY